jgi:hypothetical protein
MQIDLTPFGFTPTESLVYGALLEGGTSSGYALGKALALARANVYQALNGLVAKDAAVVAQRETPQLFRAVSPKALLARVVKREAETLERFEEQVSGLRGEGEQSLLAINGRRAFEQLAIRTAARSTGPVRAIAPAALLGALMPLWRKRAADGGICELWATGPEEVHLPFELKGRIPTTLLPPEFTGPVALLATPEVAMVARTGQPAFEGYWSSDPVIVAVISAAISHIVHTVSA